MPSAEPNSCRKTTETPTNQIGHGHDDGNLERLVFRYQRAMGVARRRSVSGFVPCVTQGPENRQSEANITTDMTGDV